MKEIETITSHELVILELLNKGFSNKRISGEIGITVNTVKFHLKKIYKKLDADNRIQAIIRFNELVTHKTRKL
jgi:LuxR family maltose regulon positive regulatory protein